MLVIANPLMNFPVGYQMQNSIVIMRTILLHQPRRAVWSIPFKGKLTVRHNILASTIPELTARSLILISQIMHRIAFSTILWFVYYVSLQKVS